MRVARRLERIEAHMESSTKYAPIIEAIERNLYYDELPKDEYKTLYCEYIGIDREMFEKVSDMILGDLHIVLRKVEPPTEKELQAIISEIEQEIFN